MPDTASLHSRSHSRVLVETLEPRILYSADLAAVVGAVGGGDVEWTQELRLQHGAAVQSTTAAEIAFVDLGVPDAGSLVSGLLAQRAQGRLIEVFTFRHDDDGLARITQTLAERQADGARFGAVHLFSHGSAGALQLGSATLDADSLLRRAAEIAGWGGALDAQADLMLYGCAVADGAEGLFLIEGLSALTGADVAASDDVTGSAASGGDWLLEQHTGQIDTAVALEAATQQTWTGTLGNEIQVNVTTVGNQTTNAETRGSQQAVTMDAAGNYTVVWTGDGQDGGGKGVFLRRFAFDGTALTGEIQVNTTTSDGQQNARIVGDSTGRFAVVWTSQNQDGTAASVYFRSFAANGTALTGEIRANASDSGDQFNAVIAMNGSNGDVVVAWQGDGPGGQSVFFRRFAQDGTALDSVDQLVTAPGSLNGEHDPAVAMNDSGQFVVAWAMGDHVYCQRFDSAGVASDRQVQMDTDIGGGIGSLPAIAIDDDGNFIGIYRKDVANMGLWVCTQLGPTFEVRQSLASGDATSASIGIGADGSAVVTYQMTGDGDQLGVYARKLNLYKGVEGAAFLVNQTTAGDQLSASVAAYDMNRFVVVWSGQGTADPDGVYARTFAPTNIAPVIRTNGGTDSAAVSVAENTTAVTTVGVADADWPIQTMTYTIVGGADQALFALDAATGALVFRNAPDAEVPQDATLSGRYVVTVQANDGLHTDTQTLEITVTDVNEHAVGPIADADAGVNAVNEDAPIGTILALTALATDTDASPAHNTVTYTLDDTADGRFAIDAGTGAVRVAGALDAETIASHRITVRATSSDGSSLTQDFDIAVRDVDEFDVSTPDDLDATVNAVRNIDAVGTAVGITAAARDADASLNAITYSLTDDAGGRFAIDPVSGVVRLNSSVVADASTVQTLVVQATSTDGSTATRSLDVAITQTNLYAPVITTDGGGATAALTVVENTSLATPITTVTATDADTDVWSLPLVYTLVGGADQALFTLDASTGVLRWAAAPDAEAPQDAGADNVCVVTVQVSDGLRTDAQTLTITLADVNEAAVTTPVDADPSGDTVAENAAIGTAVGVRVQASDADATLNTVTYTLDDTAGGRFAIDASTGQLTVAGALDAETTLLHTVVVRATSADGSHDTLTVQIAVQDVNEYGLSLLTDADPGAEQVREDDPVGTVVGLTAQAQDRDATDHDVSYSLTDDAGGRFAIHATTGVLTIARALDAETAQQHTVVVRALSSDGSVQIQSYAVAVSDVDEFDVNPITDTDAAVEVLAETVVLGTRVGWTAQAVDADVTRNTITYTLLDSAGGRFAIDAGTGVLTVAAALDAEIATAHTVVVRATSSDLSTATQAVTIAVTDVDEFDLAAVGDVDATADAVAENAAVGSTVGLQARAVDADVSLNTVTYALTDDAGGRFVIDASTGRITVAVPLDAEAALQHTLVVRATSADGSQWSQAFTVAVTDVDEFDLSAVTDTDAGRDVVAESAAPGTDTGLQARAVDADATNHTVTYVLTDDAGGRFAIDASTGRITVASPLDAEAAAAHTLVVRATSSDGSQWTQAFAVAVTDVDEFDLALLGDVDAAVDAVSETAAVGSTVGVQWQAADADATRSGVTYTLDDSAGGRFSVDAGSGLVRLARSLAGDDEQTASHTLVLRAASDDGSSAVVTLQVAVLPVNDQAPVITSDWGGATAVRHVDENTLAVTQVQAADADRSADTLTYTLSGDDAALFTLDAATGMLQWRTAPDRETPRDANADGVYALQVQASDGLHRAVQTLSVVVDNVDEAPVLVANTLAIAEGGSARPVLLAQDVDTTAARLVYTVVDAHGGGFERVDAPGVALTQFTQAEVDAGTIRFVSDGGEAVPGYRLVLADDRQALAAQTAAVAYTLVNDVPVVSTVALGTLAEDGSRLLTAAELLATARDAEGDALTVSGLRLTSGEGTLTDLGGGRWRFDPAANWHGSVTLAGWVEDGQAATPLTAALVVQSVNDAPQIVSGEGAATLALDVAENLTAVTTVMATDADADPTTTPTLRYTVAGGADAARFAIDPDTGALRFVAAPDREQPADADGDHRYDVVVEVSDGQLVARQTLQVTVTNVNEAPVVQRNALVLSDGITTLVLHATDPDTPSTALIYRVETVSGGYFARATALGVSVQDFTQAELDAAQVVWVAPSGATSAAYVLQLSDGQTTVQVGAPTLEHRDTQTVATLTDTTLLGLGQSDPAVATAAGGRTAAGATTASTTGSTTAAGRRSEPTLAEAVDPNADAGLGLGRRAESDTTTATASSTGSRAEDVAAAVSRVVGARTGPVQPVERVDPVLDLPSEDGDVPRRLGLVTELDLWGSQSGNTLSEQLDRLRQEVAEAQQAGLVSLASTALVSTGLSVGYVIWLVRGGVLMTSLMSVVPAWAGMDPLPVLAEMRRGEAGAAGDTDPDGDDDPDNADDPVEKLFGKARRLLAGTSAASSDTPETSA